MEIVVLTILKKKHKTTKQNHMQFMNEWFNIYLFSLLDESTFLNHSLE